MTFPSITLHALERAVSRWMEPDLTSARNAIRHVLKHGTPQKKGDATDIHHGNRCVRVVDGTVVTVFLYRRRRLNWLLCRFRQDHRERTQHHKERH